MISLLVPTSTPLSASRHLLEVVAAIKRFGQHDLGVCVIRLEFYGLLPPSLRVVEPIGKQGNPAELKDCRIVLRILGDDSCVDVAGLGKLPSLEELSGGFGLVRLGRRLSGETSRGNQGERDADAGMFHSCFRWVAVRRADCTRDRVPRDGERGGAPLLPHGALRLKPRA